MKKKTFFLCLITMLFGCYEEERNLNDVIRYNESSELGTLDPVFAKDQARVWVTNQIFDGLVEFDSKLNILPSIAKGWKINNNGTEYTFNLNDNIYFHTSMVFANESRLVTAYDFDYSFRRLISSEVASPGAWVMNNVKSFVAINDTTFQINLHSPFAPFLGMLTMQYFSVVPKEAVEYYQNDFGRNPIGTGPYYFKIWKEGEKLVLRKNKKYFKKGLPKSEAISITFIPDKQAAFLEFLKGNLDFISGIDASYKDEVLTFDGHLKKKYNDIINMSISPYLNTEYLGFLTDPKIVKDPEKNRLINRAINLSFDREEMLIYLRNGIGIPASQGFIPKGMPSYLETMDGFLYNKEEALSLLEKAGFPNGEGLPIIYLETNTSYLDICEYIQNKCSLIGVNIKVNVNPPSILRQKIATSKAGFFRASWIADYADAENYLSLFYSRNFSPNGPNYTHFYNKEYDSLYLYSFSLVEDSLRFNLYNKMDSIIIYYAPIVPLYYDECVRFSQKNVLGLEANPMNLLDLRYVVKK